jgi:4-alpha-glucanotransferase
MAAPRRMTSPDPTAWGIQLTHEESGSERALSRDTVAALLGAMHARGERPRGSSVITMRPGQSRRLDGATEVTTEDGGTVALDDGRLPRDLPLGYHRLWWRDGRDPAHLIVSPGRCHLPSALKAWGWAVQLYALRSARSWGIGDLADLERLMEWTNELGGSMCLVNPLHAVAPGPPQQASPYFPGSRLWRNPLYLPVEELDEARAADVDLAELIAAGRALNGHRRIDRDAVYVLKLDALERIWRRAGRDDDLDAFARRRGAPLEGFATWMTLAERYGRDSATWPIEVRRPDASGVARFRRAHLDRVRFHMWLQLLLDRQLRRAAGRGGLVQDLAVGLDPKGPDAWLWQDVFADGVHAGAPPDAFNARGQDWGVLAFDPWRLRDAGYEPFVETVRASLTAGGGVRIDHVMGLWRLYWVPLGVSPRAGGYVRYPAHDLLDIVALESDRAGAYVVGEDLGTVEPRLRWEMAARDMLGYRVLWFEQVPPARFPRKVLAAVTTHDLPTIAGLWTGEDVEAQRALGLTPDEGAHEALRRRLARALGLARDAPVRDVVTATYELLASAPCALLAATLEDALEVAERPNHPGTTEAWPNWSRALPRTLEELVRDEGTGAISRALARGRP